MRRVIFAAISFFAAFSNGVPTFADVPNPVEIADHANPKPVIDPAAFVYPGDVTLSFEGSIGVSFFRPDQHTTVFERPDASGVVSYMNDRNEVARTEHLVKDCAAVSPAELIH